MKAAILLLMGLIMISSVVAFETQISSNQAVFNGNVGIGTVSPSSSLDVVGIIASTQNGGLTQLFNPSSSIGAINVQSGNNFQIRTGNSPRVTVLGSNGFVGIGIVNPTANLQINSNGGTIIKAYSQGSIRFQLHNNGNLVIGSAGIGCIRDSGNNLVGGLCASDIRLKKNIQDLSSTLEKIKNLRVVTYQWKNDSLGNNTHTGLIAQEVQEVAPELVGRSDDGYFSVKYNVEYIMMLTKAVQEQQQIIEALQQRIEALEN